MTICPLVILPQDAAVENEINSGARNPDRAAEIKHIPITGPEIKLPVRRR
jgi:hypothetical protein